MSLPKRATVYFDPEIHRALRLRSATTDRSISDMVNEAVKLSLAEDAEDLAAFRRVLIKTSAAREIEAVDQKKDRRRVISGIQSLAENPRPPGCQKLAITALSIPSRTRTGWCTSSWWGTAKTCTGKQEAKALDAAALSGAHQREPAWRGSIWMP
jgi:hypothetical protein